MTIRVLLCDDQALVTDGIQLILETDSTLKVVGVARDGVQAVEMVQQVKPDIVLMDLKMPGMNGVHATQAIRRDHPHIPVLVLTTFDGDDWVLDAIRSGAAGYLLKDTPRDRLIAAVKDTVAGKAHIDPSVAGKLLSRVANAPSPQAASMLTEQLNERELDILRLMTHGLNNSDIAKRMFLSEGTVRNYASAIFDKLGVNDRTQAVVLALRFGLANANDS
jgi:DNA-binding NarL/FixJ family response regulator